MPVNPPGAIELQHYDLVPPVTTFALPAAGTNNATLGVRTGAGRYVLKRYAVPHGPAGLRYQHDLLTWLQGRGLSFSLPAPVATSAGATWLRDGAGYCALLPLLPGDRPDHGNPAHLEAVGAALGELHRALRAYSAAPRPGMPRFGDLAAIHPGIFAVPRSCHQESGEFLTQFRAFELFAGKAPSADDD